jgi:hypothetical protein
MRCPEDGGRMYHRNVGVLSHNITNHGRARQPPPDPPRINPAVSVQSYTNCSVNGLRNNQGESLTFENELSHSKQTLVVVAMETQQNSYVRLLTACF